MSDSTSEYLTARADWVVALKEETAASVRVKAARHRFVLARDSLRAEEHELLTEVVRG